MNCLQQFYKALKLTNGNFCITNNLCGKLTSSLELPIIFDVRFKVTTVTVFIFGFNLLSCESNNFTFKVL